MVLPEVGCGRLWGAGAAKLGAVGPAAASEPPGLSLQTWPASGCPPPAPARTHASTHAPACGQRTECAQPKSVWAAWARRGRCCARLRSPLGAPAGPSLPGRSLHMQVMQEGSYVQGRNKLRPMFPTWPEAPGTWGHTQPGQRAARAQLPSHPDAQVPPARPVASPCPLLPPRPATAAAGTYQLTSAGA